MFTQQQGVQSLPVINNENSAYNYEPPQVQEAQATNLFHAEGHVFNLTLKGQLTMGLTQLQAKLKECGTDFLEQELGEYLTRWECQVFYPVQNGYKTTTVQMEIKFQLKDTSLRQKLDALFNGRFIQTLQHTLPAVKVFQTESIDNARYFNELFEELSTWVEKINRDFGETYCLPKEEEVMEIVLNLQYLGLVEVKYGKPYMKRFHAEVTKSNFALEEDGLADNTLRLYRQYANLHKTVPSFKLPSLVKVLHQVFIAKMLGKYEDMKLGRAAHFGHSTDEISLNDDSYSFERRKVFNSNLELQTEADHSQALKMVFRDNVESLCLPMTNEDRSSVWKGKPSLKFTTIVQLAPTKEEIAKTKAFYASQIKGLKADVELRIQKQERFFNMKVRLTLKTDGSAERTVQKLTKAIKNGSLARKLQKDVKLQVTVLKHSLKDTVQELQHNTNFVWTCKQSSDLKENPGNRDQFKNTVKIKLDDSSMAMLQYNVLVDVMNKFDVTGVYVDTLSKKKKKSIGSILLIQCSQPCELMQFLCSKKASKWASFAVCGKTEFVLFTKQKQDACLFANPTLKLEEEQQAANPGSSTRRNMQQTVKRRNVTKTERDYHKDALAEACQFLRNRTFNLMTPAGAETFNLMTPGPLTQLVNVPCISLQHYLKFDPHQASAIPAQFDQNGILLPCPLGYSYLILQC